MAVADQVVAKNLVRANQEGCQIVVSMSERCDYQDDFFEMVAELAEALSSKQWCCRCFEG